MRAAGSHQNDYETQANNQADAIAANPTKSKLILTITIPRKVDREPTVGTHDRLHAHAIF